jgi:gliding motility-associated-like protein
MRRLINFITIFFTLTLATSGQCDVRILEWDAINGDLSIEVVNSTNCGCNEFTSPGTTCETSASSTVQNNETISHFVYGLHLEGDASPWTECVDNTNHDGFSFKVQSSSSIYFNELESGDIHNVNLWEIFNVANSCWEEILQYAEDNSVCAELVIWQINLSQTANTFDWPGVGWTPFDNPNGTQEYPDGIIIDNVKLYCPSMIYPGCTDPVALNYDPEATEDNGTCVYSIGPDLVQIEMNITNWYCNSLGIPVYQYQATVTNIGTEPVTYFCLDDFLSTTSYQCYNGLANSSVYVAPGDTVTVGGALQVNNGWNDGQSNFMSIESVPGEIVTGNNNFVFQMPDGLNCQDDPEPEPCDTVYIEVEVPIYVTDTITEFVTDTVVEYITEYIIEYVTDTVYEEIPIYLTDTLYITETEYIVDTLYITEYVTDTIYITETEYITDTLYITEYDTTYIDVIIDNYIYVTDTITEYIVVTEYIDCETGLPCEDDPGFDECPDWTTIHIPNAFTPNGDGVNEVWQIKYDLNCWEDVEFWIFNRWGVEIYHDYGDSFDSYPYWDGSVRGGNHYVSDGVYTYIVRGKKMNSAQVIQKTGHITIFR